MCFRDRPAEFGPRDSGIRTFVAITHSSRLPISRTSLPVTCSETPREYTSAVSKKLMPASMARTKKGRAAASSSTQGRQAGLP